MACCCSSCFLREEFVPTLVPLSNFFESKTIDCDDRDILVLLARGPARASRFRRCRCHRVSACMLLYPVVADSFRAELSASFFVVRDTFFCEGHPRTNSFGVTTPTCQSPWWNGCCRLTTRGGLKRNDTTIQNNRLRCNGMECATKDDNTTTWYPSNTNPETTI